MTADSISAHTFQDTDGKITAISNQSVAVAPHNKKVKTYFITNATVCTLDGTPCTLSGIAAGQFAKVRTYDGVTADRILAKSHEDATGAISVINPSLITITYRNGQSRTFAIEPTTVIKVNGVISTASSLFVGEPVTVSTADGGTALSVSVGGVTRHRKHR
jgi:hypothetical protein